MIGKEVYSSFSPKQKALADIFTIVLVSALSAGAVVLIGSMGWWIEIGFAFLAYAIFCFLHLLYQIKLHEHIQEELHK